MASWFDAQLKKPDAKKNLPTTLPTVANPPPTATARPLILTHHELRSVFLCTSNKTCFDWTIDFCGTRTSNGKTDPLQVKRMEVKANTTTRRHLCDLKSGSVATTQSVEASCVMHQQCFMVLTKSDLMARSFSQVQSGHSGIINITIQNETSISQVGHSFPIIKFEWVNAEN